MIREGARLKEDAFHNKGNNTKGVKQHKTALGLLRKILLNNIRYSNCRIVIYDNLEAHCCGSITSQLIRKILCVNLFICLKTKHPS